MILAKAAESKSKTAKARLPVPGDAVDRQNLVAVPDLQGLETGIFGGSGWGPLSSNYSFCGRRSIFATSGTDLVASAALSQCRVRSVLSEDKWIDG